MAIERCVRPSRAATSIVEMIEPSKNSLRILYRTALQHAARIVSGGSVLGDRRASVSPTPGAFVEVADANGAAGAEGMEAGSWDTVMRVKRLQRRPFPGYAAASFGVSANAASKAFSRAAIVSSVSSPMFEMRKVFPFSFP